MAFQPLNSGATVKKRYKTKEFGQSTPLIKGVWVVRDAGPKLVALEINELLRLLNNQQQTVLLHNLSWQAFEGFLCL